MKPFSPSQFGSLRDPFCRAELLLVLLVALAMSFLAACLLGGCATTAPGLAREQAIYRVGTNIVSQVETLVPYLPPPVSTPATVILGGISAALAAWNMYQQKSIRLLKNGNGGSGNGSVAGKSPAAPPGNSAQPSGIPPVASL